MASRSFSDQNPSRAHLSTGEIKDLREDVEAGFVDIESEVAGPAQSQANIRLNTQPTATDTITIGADVYEFVAALGDETGNNIGVLRGASAAAALANIIEAINGSGVASAVSGARGSENVVASVYNTDFLHIERAGFPGGPSVKGAPGSIALADALTAAVAWDHANLNEVDGDGPFRKMLFKLTATTANIAADFDLVVPGVPVLAACPLVTDAAGAPDATGKAASVAGQLVVVQARNAVTVDLDGGGTDPVDTDIVYVEVTYLAA